MSNQQTIEKLVESAAKDGRITADENNEILRQSEGLTEVNLALAFARQAVRHLQPKLGLVANWDLSVPTSAENIYMTTGDELRARAAENAADKCVYPKVKGNPAHQQIINSGGIRNLDHIKIIAGLAETYGCGNCAEQAARAFLYLLSLGVVALDYMRLEGADHAFVVLGRRPTAPVAENDSWLKWGDSAVVCDVWAGGLIKYDPRAPVKESHFPESYTAYPAKLLGQNMKAMFPTFQYPVLEYRYSLGKPNPEI